METATLLPTEIIQTILSYSTPEAFHAARQISQSWRYAAFCAIILQRQVQCMPVPISMEVAKKSSTGELNALFSQAAHANLFGMRDRVEKNVVEHLLPKGGGTILATATSGNGKMLTVFSAGGLDICDVHDGKLHIKPNQGLAPLSASVSRAKSDGVTSWMSMVPPYATYQVAMSESGALLAIALGRTIQIYNLRPGFERLSPVEYTLNTARPGRSTTFFGWSDIRGVVENIQFAENDTLLRITMGREGVTTPLNRVLYLGKPPPRWGNERAGLTVDELMTYWSTNLGKVYLDSVELAKAYTEESKIFFRGLRLLPPPKHRYEGGRFFVTLVQSPRESHYCIGFISEKNEVTIVAHMPDRNDRVSEGLKTRLGSLAVQQRQIGYPTATPNLAELTPRWDLSNIPDARTTEPIIATSEDGRLLAVYEPGADQTFSFPSSGAVYLCRLPTPVKRQSAEERGSEGKLGVDITDMEPQPWPFMLGYLTLDVRDLRIEKESALAPSSAKRYVVCAETERSTYRWTVP